MTVDRSGANGFGSFDMQKGTIMLQNDSMNSGLSIFKRSTIRPRPLRRWCVILNNFTGAFWLAFLGLWTHCQRKGRFDNTQQVAVRQCQLFACSYTIRGMSEVLTISLVQEQCNKLRREMECLSHSLELELIVVSPLTRTLQVGLFLLMRTWKAGWPGENE
jgi:hypothetical protein